ncbi:MAG: ATPase [Methylobacteriaceae bacterium]|nr:ATPase [Methylobacteriaceae bacterium]
MSARHTKTRGAAPDVERQAERLLRALAEPGASAKPTDIPRPDLLAITARRKGVSLAAAHFPAAAGATLVAQDLARWSQAAGRPVLEITESGRATLRRDAAPAPEQFQAQHREVEETLLEPHGPVKRNEAESPLAWLARRKDRDGRAMLDPASFAAGERFRNDFTIAGLQPRVTSDWSNPVSGAALGDRGMHISDVMVAARQRLDAALDALGPELGSLVIDVCGFLKGFETVEAEHGWPARSAKVVLGIALARLATHYGLATGARGPARAKKLLHWGSDDYRPKIAADG